MKNLFKKKSNNFYLINRKDDSDYELEDEDNKEKKKRSRKLLNRVTKTIRFGKINVNKFFTNEKLAKPNENILSTYNNIVVRSSEKTKSGNLICYKICNVCFGFANYTCPRCTDRYCSKDCYKTHKEIKCVKYLEI